MRWIGVGAVVAALILAAAGCGGSDDSSSEAATDAAVTQTSASTETTSTDTSSSTEETSTESSGVAGLTEECQSLVAASEKFSAAASASGNGGDDLEATAAAFDEFAEQAPDELKDDFKALADVMTEYATAFSDMDLQAGDVPSADQIAELAKLGQSLGTEKVQNASAAIAAWSTANCTPNP